MTSDPWGRVDEQGNVFVKTADGERSVGSWQAGSPDEALAYFRRKYEGLVVEVELLERRVRTTDLAPKDAATAIEHLRANIVDAHAVGDLDSLVKRLDALTGVVDARREERKVARAKAQEEAHAAKERIVTEAEQLSQSTDWRQAGERLRALVDSWKAVPRLDRKTDDELWHRFSQARSAFAKRRKSHFAELDQQREGVRRTKERLVAEAEALSASTDWNDTSARYRDLMRDWKAAGRAQRDVEEQLWQRFRAAQDVFFAARSEVYAERDSEQRDNQNLKEQLLVEAEALVPIEDVKAARAALRSVNERWEGIGHVPRDARPKMEARLHAVERAIRDAEEDLWRRTNPEARARAQATVDQLQASIDKLRAQGEKARAAGNERKAREADEAVAAREGWLAEARKALEEFGG
ncbi:DUF349 domain-containing protein [Yinghuangia sp. YIM S09857]|uniref:DUF349 domain-containing protein n=1 Tax=Yinghuangia sp. YIM S09857 TaxID=3436929 RepID=UPI003F530406